jgi:hypothetical protein
MRYLTVFGICLLGAVHATAATGVCDIFRDLRSYNGRPVQITAQLILDKNRTTVSANCESGFVSKGFSWPATLDVALGPTIVERDRRELEKARAVAIEDSRRGRHVSVTATIDGLIRIKDSYRSLSDGFGPDARSPAQVVLSGLTEMRVEELPDADAA